MRINKNLVLNVIVFTCLVFNLTNTKAQNSVLIETDIKSVLSKKFSLQTFQLEQFVNRFNFDEPVIINQFESNRKNNLFLLCNQIDTILLKNIVLSGFIDTFSTLNHKLNLEKDIWYADVYTVFTYKKKTVEIILSLKLNGNNINGYSWEIIGVRSSIFLPPVIDTSNKIFINPQNNEIMFSELSKLLLSNKIDIANIYDKSISYSSLSTFRDFLQHNLITFSYIKEVKYVFVDIAGYTFTVENFIRDKFNAGLLISDIKK